MTFSNFVGILQHEIKVFKQYLKFVYTTVKNETEQNSELPAFFTIFTCFSFISAGADPPN